MSDNPYEAPTQQPPVANESRRPGALSMVFIAVLTLVATVFTFFVTCFFSGLALLRVSDYGAFVAIGIGSIASLFVGIFFGRGLWRSLSR